MVKTIVVATDGSDHAQKAVAFAGDLASKYDARLVLVHVLLRGEMSEDLRHMAEVEHRKKGKSEKGPVSLLPLGRYPISNLTPGASEGESKEVLEGVAEQILDDAERIAKEHGATKVEKQTEDGDPVKRVLATVEDTHADLLVTGSRGLSDMKGMLVGSVSHKLSHLSPVTCIAVR